MAVCLLILGFFISLGFSPVCAQEDETTAPQYGTVKGIVRGMVINDGYVFYNRIAGASIVLELSGKKTLSTLDGRFTMDKVPPGTHQLIISNPTGETVRKTVTVRQGKTTRAGYIPIFLGIDQSLPSVSKGCIIASFIEMKPAKIPGKRTSENVNKSMEEGTGGAGLSGAAEKSPADTQLLTANLKSPASKPDSPQSRLVFYRPDSAQAFLETVLDEDPTWLCTDSAGSYLAITTRQSSLYLLDLEKLQMVKKLRFTGTPADLRTSGDGRKFYVTYYNNKSSGILIVDPELRKVTKHLKPGVDGLFVASWPLETQNAVLGIVNGLTGGHIAFYDLKSKTVRMMQAVGEFPVDLLYLRGLNRILVSNNQGNTITFLDADTLVVTGIQSLEGSPSRMATDAAEKKAYVALTDKNQVNVLEASSGRLLRKIRVGNKPFWLKRAGNFLYVCNRQDGTISIIDTTLDKVVRCTYPEESATANAVEVVQ